MASEASLGISEQPPSSRTKVGISQLLQYGLGQSTGTWRCQDRLGETPGAFLSLEVLPPILGGEDPAVCENWLVIICYSSQVPVLLHFLLRGTGPTRGNSAVTCGQWMWSCRLMCWLPTGITGRARADGQMEPLWAMDEKYTKYWQGHLFPAVLNSFSKLLRTGKIISGKEALTWPPFLQRFLAHYSLSALC